jgi:diacylglycerol kinase
MMVAIREQQNIKVFFICAAVSIVLGIILKLSKIEWAIIFLTIAFCLALETINMSLEKLLDMISPEYNGQTKVIKDITAGAVLFATFGAALVALFIFMTHIF